MEGSSSNFTTHLPTAQALDLNGNVYITEEEYVQFGCLDDRFFEFDYNADGASKSLQMYALQTWIIAPYRHRLLMIPLEWQVNGRKMNLISGLVTSVATEGILTSHQSQQNISLGLRLCAPSCAFFLRLNLPHTHTHTHTHTNHRTTINYYDFNQAPGPT